MVGTRIAVLVVEDEALLRLAAADALGDSGFVVHEAASADEAMSILAQQPGIDIVFTDIDMPGQMNGLDLVAHVLREQQDVAILVTSGHATLPSDLAVGFLPKPYDFDALVPLLTALKKAR